MQSPAASSTEIVPAVAPPLRGELIPPVEKSVSVIAARNPFKAEVARETVPAGQTLAELVAYVLPNPRLARRALVTIGDEPIARELWHRVRPKPGTTVTVHVVPGGGGGGKSPLRFILQLAVMAAAFVVPYAIPGIVGGLLGAFTAVGGRPALNVIEPPRRA